MVTSSMDTKRILKSTLILLSVVAFQKVGATSAPLYVVGPMPDHIAYLTLMQELSRAEAQHNHGTSIKLIEDRMSLDNAHATLFLQFMVSSYEQIVSTNRAISTRVLCNGTMPRYDKRDAHQVIGALDDIKEANLRRSYERAQANLGAEATRHLNEWLATIKLQDSGRASDRNGAYLGHNRNITQLIDDACRIAPS